MLPALQVRISDASPADEGNLATGNDLTDKKFKHFWRWRLGESTPRAPSCHPRAHARRGSTRWSAPEQGLGHGGVAYELTP